MLLPHGEPLQQLVRIHRPPELGETQQPSTSESTLRGNHDGRSVFKQMGTLPAPTICPRWHRVFLKTTALGLLLLLLTALGVQGWWLVAASRAQQLPRPSLSLHPSQRVSLGDNVTLRCHLPRLASRIQLCQDQRLTSCMDKYEMQDVADFYITTKREHAGMYRCQYQVQKPLQTSEKSDPVELVVTDLSFPPPGISLSPGGHVGTGTNITIRCWNKDYGATFLLHKDGCSAALQRQHPDEGGMATFTLFQVTPTDNGTYRCSYLIKGYFPLLSSPLGDNVTLEVTPTSAHPGAAVESHRNMVVAVAGGCAVAFVFIPLLIIFFLITTRRCQRLRDKHHGAPPRRPEAVQLQVPCSDSDCLTYVELQAEPPTTRSPAPPADPQPPTIYADVRTGGPH
ncbi:T-cell-interacting, activating receptor on myeloid cells protein 1 isoform X3 [Gallus gallus]|uniref:T-cell-interacting, activating receptor on myeloid cells protein 1 isoform X3 n=1 Tax=Gallus gallus TaxID=9031 RepID=UPI001F002D02|nr:T-cell-interacting, activating receptor on myeloid cells protein 1 isoform X3 [Gallus gallus]